MGAMSSHSAASFLFSSKITQMSSGFASMLFVTSFVNAIEWATKVHSWLVLNRVYGFSFSLEIFEPIDGWFENQFRA